MGGLGGALALARDRAPAARGEVGFPSRGKIPACGECCYIDCLENPLDRTGELAVSAQRVEAPQPGRALIPIELYLRGQGQAGLADRWRETVGQADSAMRELNSGKSDRLLPAAKRLAALKRMAEEDVAPALNVSIGFSDADGD